ncbi:MAG: hypothetical protein KGJ59_03600 [Bacteroidota bacterium]|nr:hypothetical protein [Bacteroidota bacterium]
MKKRKPSRVLPNEIRPIVEFYPLKPVKRKVKWLILDPKLPRDGLIQAELKSAHGIYIFYNSQCRAIYLGKADQLTLWKELTNAFNRKREAQTLFKVLHPITGNAFKPAYKKKRGIRKRHVYLHEIASFMSAYEVGDALIRNLEALLMRAFPNELTNAKMETIEFKTKK